MKDTEYCCTSNISNISNISNNNDNNAYDGVDNCTSCKIIAAASLVLTLTLGNCILLALRW